MSQLPNKTPQPSSDAEPTLYDVLGTINTLSTGIDMRFDALEGRVGNIEAQMVTKEDLKQELAKMVTKDYLDTKLADRTGDLMVMARKGDTKITKVVGLLEHN